MNEENCLWVVIAYFNLEKCKVYGLFVSYDEAWNYAHENHKKMGFYTYEARPVLNIHYGESQCENHGTTL